jgi:hypothetical protein
MSSHHPSSPRRNLLHAVKGQLFILHAFTIENVTIQS